MARTAKKRTYSNLPVGLYVVRMRSADGLASARVVKG
jgi:hypothetical protein